MRKNRVYSITWARAIAGRIPTREELVSYLSLQNEKELLEKVTRKLGIKQQYDSLDMELKNYIGTTVINMSLVSDMAVPQLRSLHLHNLRYVLEKKLAGYSVFERGHLYAFNGVPLLETQIKKIFESESIERVRTGEPWIDELFMRMRRIAGEQQDVGLLSLFIERERVIFINKFKQLGSLAKFEVDAYNSKLAMIIGDSRPELSDSLFISEKPKVKGEAEIISTLQKKYSLQVESLDLDSFIESARHELAVKNMIRFDESNIYTVMQMLLNFEKNISTINQSIKQKIGKELTLKIIG
ncbi:MAG: hypothetical protein ACP5NC_03645 [Nitrososphaeria archaeon]